MTYGFRTQLDRLRQAEKPVRLSISDQLRFLRDPASAAAVDETVTDGGLLPPGRVVTCERGNHYLIREQWPEAHHHGTVRMDRWCAEEFKVLLDLAGVGSSGFGRGQVVFLDTETTGVHGGAGICPFLIGIGYYAGTQFEVRQYFIRNFDEEPSMLAALADFLAHFDLIVTYNGRTFDLPLVENRCVLVRQEAPFGHMEHLDLLYIARRLWKASQGSCRLTALESGLLGFFRGPDIHGSRIPQAYFDYLRTGRAGVLRSVFSHNVFDILSLAALTMAASDRVSREPAPIEDSRDLYSLARIMDRGSDRTRSIRLYERALESGLPDELRIRARERLALLYRRAGHPDRSLACCLDLIAEDAFSFPGYDGAALYHERHSGDYDAACELLDSGIDRIRNVSGMSGRRSRLEARRERLQKKRAAGRLL